MSRIGLMTLLVAGALLATAAEADQKGNKGNKGGEIRLNCPPGLAKKNPPCIPPGQVNKSTTGGTIIVVPTVTTEVGQIIGDVVLVGPGELLHGDYVVLINPQIYHPDLDGIFVRYGDHLYLIDRDRAEILDQIGPLSGWTWSWADTDFANCPPGLAKKNPPCVPPGLAKKGVTAQGSPADWRSDPYGIGDSLPDGYVTVIDPQLLAPNDNGYYVRQGDTIYRIDRTTGLVLDVISTVTGLLN